MRVEQRIISGFGFSIAILAVTLLMPVLSLIAQEPPADAELAASTTEEISWEEGVCLLTHGANWIAALKSISPELTPYSDEAIEEALFAVLGVTVKSEDALVSGEQLIAAECTDLDFRVAADLLDATLANHFDLNYDLFPLEVNDEHLSKLWGMRTNPGSNSQNAWAEGGRGNGVVVAVIDTGIDYTHPDLSGRMWRNPGEILNGIDDDGNGIIDDFYGANFYEGNGDPNEGNGTTHGTHCAGTIGASGNNRIGVSGVAPEVQLMAIRFLGPRGSTLGAIRAVNYVNEMKQVYGVNIVASSNSWGGGGYNSTLKNAINTAGDLGIVFIAAAGNSNLDTDARAFYPQGYPSTNIISVASHTSSGSRSSFSNYGATTVDISAPGSSIYSTYPGNTYRYLSGTSMATPHVSGAVAVLRAAKPDLTVAETIALLYEHSTTLPNFSGALSNPRSGLDVATAFSNLTINEPPTLAVINDQSFLASAGSAALTVSATDPDRYGEGSPGAVSTCSVNLIGTTSPEGYAFFESFSPFCASANCEEGVYGDGEKRLYGTHGEIFALYDDDSIVRVDGGLSLEIGSFPRAFDDPEILTNPSGPVIPSNADFTADCTITDSSSIELTFSWSQTFWGSASLQVSVSDVEGASVSRSFQVSVTSQPPTITPISDQRFSLSAGSASVPFQVADPDGDSVRCSATVTPIETNPPYLSFSSTYEPYCFTPGCEGPDGAKLLTGKDGEYFLVSSSDAVVRYHDQQQTSLGTFAGAFSDISLLVAPKRPLQEGAITTSLTNSPVGEAPSIPLVFSGDRVGDAQVSLTCNAKGGSTTASFNVSLSVDPPQLGNISNQATYPGAALTIPVSITNGEGITSLSIRQGVDSSARAAQLSSQFILSTYESQYDGLLFTGSKWVRGGTDYLRLQPFIDGSGELHTLIYSHPSEVLYDILPGGYYEDPTLLIDARQSSAPERVITEVTSSSLRIDIPSTYSAGTITFDMLVKKGSERLSQRFYVDVANELPTATFTSIHNIQGAVSSLQVPLSVSDGDGQRVVVALQSVKDLSQSLFETIETKGLTTRSSGYQGPGYALWSEREARWYFAVPSSVRQNEVCELRAGSETGTLYEVMPSTFCEGAERLLGIADSSGNPSATLSSTGADAYSVSISPNGARITRATLTLFDGVSYVLAHIFLVNSNQAPNITVPAQLLIAPQTRVEQRISVIDPDGDSLEYSLSAEPCDQIAHQLQRSYGIEFHRNCTVSSSDCEQSGQRKMFYSSVYNRAVFALLSGDTVQLSFESDGSNPFALLPALYYYYTEALLSPAQSFSTVQSDLNIQQGEGVTVSIQANSNACLSLTASDGDLSTTKSWMIGVSQSVSSSGVPQRDTDGDGLSDKYELRSGGDPYNPEIAQQGFSGRAVVPFIQLEQTSVQVGIDNASDEPIRGVLTAFDREGSEIKRLSVVVSPQGQERVLVFPERALGQGTLRGWLTFESDGQMVSPELFIAGNKDESRIRMAYARTSFVEVQKTPLYTAQYKQYLPLTNGHASSVPATCDQQCYSDLQLLNLSDHEVEARIVLYDENGSVVIAREEIISPGRLHDVALGDEVGAPFIGTVLIESSTRELLAFSQESGFSSGAYVYTQQVSATATKVSAVSARYESIHRDETGVISLVNTRETRAIHTTVRIARKDGSPLFQDVFRLGGRERLDFDLRSHFSGSDESLTLSISTDAPRSLLAYQHRALEDEYGVIAFLTSRLTEEGDSRQAIAHWETLKDRALLQKKTGSIQDAEMKIIEVKKARGKNGKKKRFFLSITDEAGRPVVDEEFQLCFLKRRTGTERCRRRKISTDENGKLRLKMAPKRLERLILRAVEDGARIRLTR